MTDVLSKIPLVGWGPILTIAAIAVSCLIIAVLLWRGHKVWRWVFVLLFLVFGVGAVGDYVNTKFAYYDNAADLLGIPTYPTGRRHRQRSRRPAAAQRRRDPGQRAGHREQVRYVRRPGLAASAVLQQPATALPRRLSAARKPGPADRLADRGRRCGHLPQRGARAATRSSSSCPRTSRTTSPGDSLCVDSPAQGNAETYITKDVIAAIDNKLRTITNAKGRAIGGLSMGGFCGLNLGLKHPDLYSVVIDLSGETASEPDTLPGGNQALYGGSDWQAKADANSPTKYVSTLDGSKGPAIYLGTRHRRCADHRRDAGDPAQAAGPRASRSSSDSCPERTSTPTGRPGSRTRCPGRRRSSVRASP